MFESPCCLSLHRQAQESLLVGAGTHMKFKSIGDESPDVLPKSDGQVGIRTEKRPRISNAF